MRVTEKGQVTIPKPVRDRLGIAAGSEVEFVLENGTARLRRVPEAAGAAPADYAAWAEGVRGMLDLGGLTTAAYMEWLRGHRDDRNAR